MFGFSRFFVLQYHSIHIYYVCAKYTYPFLIAYLIRRHYRYIIYRIHVINNIHIKKIINLVQMLNAYRPWSIHTRAGASGDYVTSSHQEPQDAIRLYLPLGNIYSTVIKKTTALVCTCQNTYQMIVNKTAACLKHFGSCRMNVENSIFTRQFTATLFPEVHISNDFLEYVQKSL